jgi:hypothetical protein
MRATGWAWISALVLGAVLFVACGGSSAHHAAQPATTSTTIKPQDADLTAHDFKNIHTYTKVGDHYITNVDGHLAQALAVARSKTGGRYPVGTIIQLLPQEAMVKRRAGFSPATNDWEFFSLDVSKNGTTILKRGALKSSTGSAGVVRHAMAARSRTSTSSAARPMDARRCRSPRS